MKRLLMLALGILFLLFGVAVGLFTISYLTEGAGFQFLGFLSSLTVFVRLDSGDRVVASLRLLASPRDLLVRGSRG
jgi:hypothetical protein